MSDLNYSEEDGLYEGSSPRRRYRDDDFGRSSESDVSDSHLEDMELVPKGAQAGRASPSDFSQGQMLRSCSECCWDS